MSALFIHSSIHLCLPIYHIPATFWGFDDEKTNNTLVLKELIIGNLDRQTWKKYEGYKSRDSSEANGAMWFVGGRGPRRVPRASSLQAELKEGESAR